MKPGTSEAGWVDWFFAEWKRVCDAMRGVSKKDKPADDDDETVDEPRVL